MKTLSNWKAWEKEGVRRIYTGNDCYLEEIRENEINGVGYAEAGNFEASEVYRTLCEYKCENDFNKVFEMAKKNKAYHAAKKAENKNTTQILRQIMKEHKGDKVAIDKALKEAGIC